jgi:hypothetical protein
VTRPDESRLRGTGYQHVALGFDRVVGRGGPAGQDRAELYDSPADDRLTAWPAFTRLDGPGFSVEANAFDVVHAHGDAGGNDSAILHDGEGYDQFVSTPTTSSLQGNGVVNVASNFELVVSRSTHGGDDDAKFYDFTWADDIARLNGMGFDNRAIGYNHVELHAKQGGFDRAWLRARLADDRYSATGMAGQLISGNRLLQHEGVDEVHVVWPNGRHFGPELNAVEFALDDVVLDNAATIKLGSGILHPWKIIADKHDGRHLLVITGQGETGGNSLLYRVHAATLKPIGTPLPVGASASDVIWVGDYVVVTSRGSNEIFLVDPAAWQVIDRVKAFAEPIAAVAVADDRFFIASVQVKQLQQFRIRNHRLELQKSIAIPGTTNDLSFDAAGNRLYVNHPSLHAVSEIDPSAGRIVRQYIVGGEPSYGGVIWGRFYIATNRDGYLHFIDRVTQSPYTVDLAVALNLDRAQLAVRGIEPTDVIIWDETHFVVINNRQDSLLFSFDSTSPFTAPVLLGRFTGAAFGVKVPTSDELLVTSPAVNRIDRVTITLGTPKPRVTVQTNEIGVAPVAAVRVGSGPGARMAVVTSDHRLHLIDEFTHAKTSMSMVGGYRISAWYPMTVDERGRIWLVVNGNTGRRLVAVSAEGNILFDFGCTLKQPFSISAGHDWVVVIDRTNQQVQYSDILSGDSQTIRLGNQRPRHAQILGRGEWVIIHDTNPDIGLTHYDQGSLTFHRYTSGRWLAGLAQGSSRKVFVLDYDGSLHEFDLQRATFRFLVNLPSQYMKELRYGNGGLWAASPTSSSVFLLRSDGTGVDMAWNGIPAIDVLPADGGAWFLTDAGLLWRPRSTDATWWK